MKRNTKIISAFSGTGKTFLSNIKSDKIIYDLGCSRFNIYDKPNFPQNYVKEIKNMIGKVDILLISTHKEVRDALLENNIDFTLVFPDEDLKEEYISRYKGRTTLQRVIDKVNENWDIWQFEMRTQPGCDKIILQSGQYLSDIIK